MEQMCFQESNKSRQKLGRYQTLVCQMSQQFPVLRDVFIFLKRQTKGSVASRCLCILLLFPSTESLEPSGNICPGSSNSNKKKLLFHITCRLLKKKLNMLPGV